MTSEPATPLIRQLLALTSLVADAPSGQAVLAILVEVASALFGGATGSLCLLSADGTEFELAAEVGSARPLEDGWSRFPCSDALPAGRAVLLREPILLGSIAARDEQFPSLRGLPAADRAYAILPLFDAEDRPTAALTVGFPDERSFTDAERMILDGLSQQASLALRHARRIDAERRASEVAAMVTVALASAFEDATQLGVARAVVHALQGVIADYASIELMDADGVRRVTVDPDPQLAKRWKAEDRLAPLRLDDGSPLSQVLVTGEELHVMQVTDAMIGASARSAALKVLLDELELGSAVIVPVRLGSEVIGALSLVNRRSSRALGEDVLDAARAIAARLGPMLAHAASLERERRITETLQRAMLPARLPSPPGLQVAARYVPNDDHASVGGDWYDVFALPDGTYGLCVGDVAGHDADAAAAMGQLRSAARAHALHESEPDVVLDLLDDFIVSYDVAAIATCIYAVWDPRSGHLRISNAGHPSPLLLRAGGSVEAMDMTGGPLLGIGIARARHATNVALELGDALLLYTDGLIERRGSDLNLDVARLVSQSSGLAALPPGPLCDELLHRLEPAGGWTDDVAVLALQRRGDLTASG